MGEYQRGMLPAPLEQEVLKQKGILSALTERQSRPGPDGEPLGERPRDRMVQRSARRKLREIGDTLLDAPQMRRGMLDLLAADDLDARSDEEARSTIPRGRLKEGSAPTWRDRLADKAGEIAGGDSTHAKSNYMIADTMGMLPGVGQALGVDEARHLRESGQPLEAGILGMLSLIPVGRAGKKSAEQALESIGKEVAPLAARYQELTGRPYLSPRPPAGMLPKDALADEEKALDELRATVASKEASIASRPGMLTAPKVAGYDREGEMAELLSQARANPYTQAIPGRQGLPSKAEQERLIKSFYEAGGKVPAGPWGRDPLDYQKAVQGGFEAARRDVQQLAAAKAAARSPSDFARIEAELKAATDRAEQYSKIIERLNKTITGKGG